jgi:hypothetical protein
MRFRAALAVVVVAAFAGFTPGAGAAVPLTQVSSDPFTNSDSQHMTEVEPDTFAFGSTVVAAFQAGRTTTGGSSDVGWATSTDSGLTWTSGFLPGITVNLGGGRYPAASDASVTYDAKHSAWLISTLGVGSSNAVLVSRSTDGGSTWTNPVTVATGGVDKDWIVCDDTASSPFYGRCYVEYDVESSSDLLRMKTSADGGLTWGPARSTADSAHGLGGQPVVRPNGTVMVPYMTTSSGSIRSFRSIDGGQSWRSTALVASIKHHAVGGGLRVWNMPSAEIDSSGRVFVAWSDCRFRTNCSSNDIVYATSTSETSWSAPVRVPIDATTSTVDHFVPGIAVDRSTSGSTTRIALTYHFFPTAGCSSSTCQLDVGYVSSADNGATWSAAATLAGPMSPSWLPSTNQGRMFADYISTSIVPSAQAVTVIPVASAPTGTTFDQAMYAPTGGLAVGGP